MSYPLTYLLLMLSSSSRYITITPNFFTYSFLQHEPKQAYSTTRKPNATLLSTFSTAWYQRKGWIYLDQHKLQHQPNLQVDWMIDHSLVQTVVTSSDFRLQTSGEPTGNLEWGPKVPYPFPGIVGIGPVFRSRCALSPACSHVSIAQTPPDQLFRQYRSNGIHWKEDTQTTQPLCWWGSQDYGAEYEDEAEKSSSVIKEDCVHDNICYKCVAMQTSQEGTGKIQSYTS